MFDLYFFQDSDENNQSLPNKIATDILKGILSGEILQGNRLTESEIAKKLNVSNIPVREAFYILQSIGVIERFPRKGVRVKALTTKEMKNYTDALIELFKIGIDYSESKWDEKKQDNLLQLLKETKEKLEENNVLGYIHQANKLCRYIYIVAENQAFLKYYSETGYITSIYCQTQNFEKVMQTYHVHLEALVNAIIHSDFDNAKMEYEFIVKLTFSY